MPITTIEAVNKTQVLTAVQDGPNHVSVFPVDESQMEGWIASRKNAETNPHPYTVLLQEISIKSTNKR